MYSMYLLPANPTVSARIASLPSFLRDIKTLVTFSGTLTDGLVVRGHATQINQTLALLTRNVVAHVPQVRSWQQRHVCNRVDLLCPRLLTGAGSVDGLRAVLSHLFQQRHDPLALPLGARGTVAQRCWGLWAIGEESGCLLAFSVC
jgi:hypothetical protein